MVEHFSEIAQPFFSRLPIFRQNTNPTEYEKDYHLHQRRRLNGRLLQQPLRQRAFNHRKLDGCGRSDAIRCRFRLHRGRNLHFQGHSICQGRKVHGSGRTGFLGRRQKLPLLRSAVSPGRQNRLAERQAGLHVPLGRRNPE